MRCDVWWARPEARIGELAGLLDPGEQQRCFRFRDYYALLRHVTDVRWSGCCSVRTSASSHRPSGSRATDSTAE